MNVDFWFDPACPFCWVTSRWLVRVAPERDLAVQWHSISLFFKNDPAEGTRFYEPTKRTNALLRVVEAAKDSGRSDKIGALYTEFGRHIHNRDQYDFDVAEVLERVGLDASLAAALDEVRWDDAIKSSMAEGLGLVGDDVGTPIIAVEGRHGRVGLFGPVITELPDVGDSVELWDGFIKMVNTAGFFELKRTRSDLPVPPDETVLDLLPAS